jgi:hypothetical protein
LYEWSSVGEIPLAANAFVCWVASRDVIIEI